MDLTGTNKMDEKKVTNRLQRYVSFRMYSPDAKAPEKRSQRSACFELFSLSDKTLEPGILTPVQTGIGFTMPSYIAGIVIGSLDLMKQKIDFKTALVSPDSDGRVELNLKNCSSEPFTVKEGDHIGRIAFIRILNQQAMYPKGACLYQIPENDVKPDEAI